MLYIRIIIMHLWKIQLVGPQADNMRLQNKLEGLKNVLRSSETGLLMRNCPPELGGLIVPEWRNTFGATRTLLGGKWVLVLPKTQSRLCCPVCLRGHEDISPPVWSLKKTLDRRADATGARLYYFVFVLASCPSMQM